MCFLENVIHNAVTYIEHARRKMVTSMDCCVCDQETVGLSMVLGVKGIIGSGFCFRCKSLAVKIRTRMITMVDKGYGFFFSFFFFGVWGLYFGVISVVSYRGQSLYYYWLFCKLELVKVVLEFPIFALFQ